MASVYKRSKRKGEPYTIQYRDHLGIRRTEKGFTDKGLSEQLAAQLESDARLRESGMVDVEQEKFAKHRLAAIEEHLSAFHESLGDNTGKHVRLTMTRIRKIVDGCGFMRLGDVTQDAVQTCLRRLRKTEDLGHRTYNHYLQAIDAFMNWCVSTQRLIANPLIGLPRLNAEVDVRRQRRALTPDEFQKLLAAAGSSDVLIQRYTGEVRGRIYLMSYLTGLRKNELASLTPENFSLDASPPIVTVQAAFSKHRRKDVLPLHDDLVVLLRTWLAGLGPKDKLFPRLAGRKTWLMVQKDLEAAGIPYVTSEGVADFHASGRHTHITELFRNGATVPEAKALARHSDVKMTMKYTHIGIADQAKAVSRLPVPKKSGEPAARSGRGRKTALHGRCISGVSGCPEPSSPVTEVKLGQKENPAGGGVYVSSCHSVTEAGKVEAAGIEPAS